MRILETTLLAALIAASSPARAQPLDGRTRPVGVDAETRAKFLRLQQLRAARPVSRPPVKDLTVLSDDKRMTAAGTLREAVDGMVLLSVPINEVTAVKMTRIGIRRVQAAKDIAHNTIFESELYLQYMTAPGGPPTESLEGLVGRRVNLKLARNLGGYAVVTEVTAR